MNGFEKIYYDFVKKYGDTYTEGETWHKIREEYKEQVGIDNYYLEAIESDLFGKLSLNDGMQAIVFLFKQWRKEKLEIEQRLNDIEKKL